jgi:molybdate transport system substrate-binding protein
VGIVALSLAVSPNMKEKGRYVEIATGEYPSIDQACVILSASKNKDVARQFLAFIKTPPVAEILHNYGFDIPQR